MKRIWIVSNNTKYSFFVSLRIDNQWRANSGDYELFHTRNQKGFVPGYKLVQIDLMIHCSGCFDMFENISLLSASETIFRHCLSIAEVFVQNWIYFPISITEENVEQVSAILTQSHSEVAISAFSIELLEDSFLDYKCIMQILIEVLRDVWFHYVI